MAYYTISQAAQRCGLSAHTLRYYDKEGLLPFVDRAHSGIRRFKDTDFEWLVTINCLKETGMSIKHIKIFIDWCAQGDETLEKRLAMFMEQKKIVEAQLRAITKNLERIDFKIWYYKTAVKAGSVKVFTTDQRLGEEKTQRQQKAFSE